jgi:hypothetical protein
MSHTAQWGIVADCAPLRATVLLDFLLGMSFVASSIAVTTRHAPT